jgi:hypothetical protein
MSLVGAAPEYRRLKLDTERADAAGRCCATLTKRERRILAEHREKADASVDAAPARSERGAMLLSTEQKA